MEEILASIRRIISEGDEEPEDGAKEGVEEAAEAANGAEAEPEEAAEAVNGEDSEHAEAEEDVLELTEMVNEDGTITSLAEDADESDEKVAENEQPEGGMSEPDTVEEEEPKAEAAAEEEEAAGEEVTDDEAEAVTEEAVEEGAEAEEAEPPEAADEETADSLVSEETAAASTESLAALATVIVKEPQSKNNVSLGTGNTLEDLVKDMIRPMLKDWLDLNLAPMVKGLVKKEIARMVRRAEDD